MGLYAAGDSLLARRLMLYWPESPTAPKFFASRQATVSGADPFDTLRAGSAAITLADLVHLKRLMMHG
jgi:hypothetical protein